MNEKVEVIATVRQLYDAKMHDPEETFLCDAQDAVALEWVGAIRRKPETAEPKKQKGHYDRRDMRAES